MKCLLFGIFIIYSIVVFSQEKTLNIGANYVVVFNNYSFYAPVYDKYNIETSYTYKSKYNYSTGICLEYDKKFYIATNINYTTKGYELNYNFTAINNNDPLLPVKSVVEAGYIDIFAKIGKSFVLQNKFLIIPNVKLGYGFLMNNKITTFSGDNKKYTSKNGEGILIKQNLKQNIISTGLELNFRYKISNSLSIGIAPCILYNDAKISDMALKYNNIYYSIELGLIYKIL